MASSSSVSVFDNYRFKSAFNEELYNSIVKNKKVTAECCIDLDDDEYPEVKEQISLRGWRRLAAPKQEISIDLIHEFYANAILTEEEMEEAGRHTFRSYIRDSQDGTGKEKAKLGFPSTIFKLCKEAGVLIREFRRTRKIQAEKPITAKRMESTRLPRPVQRRQQENEDEDEPMPQAEEGNEEGNEGQAHDYDYHHQPEYEYHQPDYEQPQPDFEHHQEFNEPPYQQQALENMSKNQAEYMAELRDIKGKQQELYENNDRFYNQVRQEQKEMVQEIQQIKNY
ncbi:hypothetical protein PIB30_099010 [Stylosanthes scabra]|uniref:Uncharacterized protein n=1 Tax=Stylosanthes scabra TaxID=79078 RepID=A0ABU6YZN5_9FABA|nr:hypothetical protein [Stylosanthes scabra]